MEHNPITNKLQLHRKRGDDNFMQCIIVLLNTNYWGEKQKPLHKCRLIFFFK